MTYHEESVLNSSKGKTNSKHACLRKEVCLRYTKGRSEGPFLSRSPISDLLITLPGIRKPQGPGISRSRAWMVKG